MATADPNPTDDRPGIAARLERQIATLEAELAEIDMLMVQARSESERHEARRAGAAAKVAAWQPTSGADPKELIDLNAQLLNLTRRALVMDSQVDVLGGKQRALRRYRDGLTELLGEIGSVGAPGSTSPPSASAAALATAADAPAASADGSLRDDATQLPPAVTRVVLAAQEDLRRDIAREMHDGPAQSLTNIVLQAQIVDRLITRDPAAAAEEVRELIAMVQSTLDATKSFIFDVRPMVLDDLGLVPTLRRAARDRGRRAQIPVEFDSLGHDRRLSMELESGLFRILDEALAAYLGLRPSRVDLRLDWSDQLKAVIRSVRGTDNGGSAIEPATATADAATTAEGAASSTRGGRPPGRRGGKAAAAPEAEMPAALAAMIEDRRGERAAADSASVAALGLPMKCWRDIQARAMTLGIAAELAEDGAQLRLVIELPADG